MSGVEEVEQLADDLVEAAVDVGQVVREVIQQGMSDIKDQWRNNARVTAGAHGRLYPNSITYETRLLAGSVVGEVGPDSSKPQGRMGRGFELGSVHQPPHLDGLLAVEAATGPLERRMSTAVGFALP